MTFAHRYPIPESLLNKPENYWLKIDSFMHSIYNFDELKENLIINKDLKVPANSEASEDELLIESTSEEEEKIAVINGEISQKEASFDTRLIALCPFEIDKLMVFPHKARDGDVPLKLLKKPKPDYIIELK